MTDHAVRATRALGIHGPAPAHRDASAFQLGGDGESARLRLHWPSTAELPRPLVLRVTIAREFWGTTDMVVHGRRHEIGRTMLDHVDAFEHVDVPLRPGDPDEFAAGLELGLDGPGAVEVFGPGVGEEGSLGPRLLGAGTGAPGTRDRLLDGLASPASIQAFGWKLGCVLDGLLDLADATGEERFATRARAHLAEFLDPDGMLAYHDPWGRPVRGEVYGIEGMLPLAAMARLGDPGRALAVVERFLPSYRRDDGAVRDHAMLSTEGMYTVAYPLALIGCLTGRADFVEDAALQLRVRMRELRDGVILLRRHEDGRIEFRDWVRAWTWYLLGLARVGPLLADAGHDTTDLAVELSEVAEAAARRQPRGLIWPTFLDDPATPAETSGSAGIAAAWALGARAGLLESTWADRAAAVADALLLEVGAEGVLTGASQANKGGERLQRSRYRVNSQMGSGLLAQLVAALIDPARRR